MSDRAEPTKCPSIRRQPARVERRWAVYETAPARRLRAAKAAVARRRPRATAKTRRATGLSSRSSGSPWRAVFDRDGVGSLVCNRAPDAPARVLAARRRTLLHHPHNRHHQPHRAAPPRSGHAGLSSSCVGMQVMRACLVCERACRRGAFSLYGLRWACLAGGASTLVGSASSKGPSCRSVTGMTSAFADTSASKGRSFASFGGQTSRLAGARPSALFSPATRLWGRRSFGRPRASPIPSRTNSRGASPIIQRIRHAPTRSGAKLVRTET
jgi:hypothetical protein